MSNCTSSAGPGGVGLDWVVWGSAIKNLGGLDGLTIAAWTPGLYYSAVVHNK